MTIIVSCGNKKSPFDYSTLPTEWTVLEMLDDDNEYAVCDEVSELMIIAGNTLTRAFPLIDEKWEFEIFKAYQTDDIIVFTLEQEEIVSFSWLDKERGIAEWKWRSDESDFGVFATKEKLSEFPKARCSQGDIVFVEKKSKKLEDLVSSDETIFEKVFGDLNNDGKEDCIVITKQTAKSAFVTDEYRGELDRNRRGILIAFKEGEYYNTTLKIPDCFSSENEDGGVYFAPELSVEIKKGNLIVHYGHGRYGWWQYTFRYRNNNFELIGYDSSRNRGPITEEMTSINFLTKKKQTQTNTNLEAEVDGEEVFEETWQNIVFSSLVKLTDIKDFDEFDISNYYSDKRK
ncbi:MAG: hypothetical protein LBG67_03545 [Campylobacteraceae bacterium]|nr:hypothetical protein [Campylobacteraceae bacterium]